MKIVRTEVLIKRGAFFETQAFNDAIREIETAISKVVWPLGSSSFAINPTKKANGVKPIKNGCMAHLGNIGWELETPVKLASGMKPGPLDATKVINDKLFALEWETGNISSSHRAMNKMAQGMLEGALIGGTLILPSRAMYNYLTDRVGNFQELSPYFFMWKSLSISEGFLSVIEIEHDSENNDSPLISKGTDGWAEFQKNEQIII
jgi:hypothetical protein